jgi:hypothetical protein
VRGGFGGERMKTTINGHTYNLKKKDFLIQLAFWDSARNSDDLYYYKNVWKDYAKLWHLHNECAFCETFISNDSRCKDCPLKSCGRLSTYDKWSNQENYRKTEKGQLRLKKKSAEKIYQVTKEFIIKYWGKV